jgi:hypothetical protein
LDLADLAGRTNIRTDVRHIAQEGSEHSHGLRRRPTARADEESGGPARTVHFVPFTGSHPAAVLLLLRSPLPVSALIAGTIAPDLPYYLPFSPGWPTHQAASVVSIDVVLGGVAWLAWHWLLAAPAVAFAPDGVRARLVDRVVIGLRPRIDSARNIVLVLLALAIGAGTHVLWDEFTHPSSWGTEHLPALASEWGGLPVHRWLQHGSGLIGAAVIAAWLIRWWQQTEPRPVRARPAAPWIWAGLLVVGTVAGLTAAIGASSPRAAGFAGATRGGAAAFVVAVALALAWHVADHNNRSLPA